MRKFLAYLKCLTYLSIIILSSISSIFAMDKVTITESSKTTLAKKEAVSGLSLPTKKQYKELFCITEFAWKLIMKAPTGYYFCNITSVENKNRNEDFDKFFSRLDQYDGGGFFARADIKKWLETNGFFNRDNIKMWFFLAGLSQDFVINSNFGDTFWPFFRKDSRNRWDPIYEEIDEKYSLPKGSAKAIVSVLADYYISISD